MGVGASAPSSWVDDRGFSLSTTTVSQGYAIDRFMHSIAD